MLKAVSFSLKCDYLFVFAQLKYENSRLFFNENHLITKYITKLFIIENAHTHTRKRNRKKKNKNN